MKITVNLSGGLHTYFKDQTSFEVILTQPLSPMDFVLYIRDTYLAGDPKKNFVVDDKLFVHISIIRFFFHLSFCRRPGILYLINDADYVLLDNDYTLSDGDVVDFISTIHGG